MKNALYVSLAVLSLVGCGQLSQSQSRNLVGEESTRYVGSGASSGVSARTLKQSSDDIAGSIGSIYSKFDDLNSQCDATNEAINEFNEKLVTTQANLAPLQLALESNLAFVEPFENAIDAKQTEMAGKNGEITGYDATLADLSNPATYRDRVKARRKGLKSSLSDARKALSQAYKAFKQAPYPSSKYDEAEQKVRENKSAIANYKGHLKTLRDTISSNLTTEKQTVQGLREAASREVTRLQGEIAAYEGIVKPYWNAIWSQRAQIASLPTVEGLVPYVLPPICQLVSK